MTASLDGTGHTQACSNLVLITTVLASGVAFIAVAVVSVGLPAIGSAFRAGAVDLQWVISTYLLPLSALLLLGGAVAPPTIAVVGSVDNQHAGSASGPINVVARTGGMAALALPDGVLVAVGSRLVDRFHVVAIACAIASIAGAGCAFFLVENRRRSVQPISN